jgi:CDP-glycerol glycerophosphotransferase
MVLLEAMCLGRPWISTDIPGCRDLAELGYGLLVENSVQGLVDGMLGFLAGGEAREKAMGEFDYEAYQEKAVQKFKDLFCAS